MQLRLSERVPIYNLKVEIIFPLKVATKPKDACDYTDIAMDEADKFSVDFFSFNGLKLDIYGRSGDDTFIPWLHGKILY